MFIQSNVIQGEKKIKTIKTMNKLINFLTVNENLGLKLKDFKLSAVIG